MSSDTSFPAEPYFEVELQIMEYQVRKALEDSMNTARLAPEISKRLRNTLIPAYENNPQEPTYLQILGDFLKLVDLVKKMKRDHGEWRNKNLDGDLHFLGDLRRKLKFYQRLMYCFEAGLQQLFRNMQRAGVFDDANRKEMEQKIIGDLVRDCGVDPEKDYNLRSNWYESLKLLKILWFG
ncbi:hypothetical protein K458DRAFT_403307 [Lentithecium fluviatile CBS 122367]|uniref:Uncharacterized protein n=1 Tax=Lentithecium fluviatile CBS 122367 TaxID=1168545 RepID=A0A6G1J3S0_9PLEO|nr:hypothetical protein K458DRAFT_403307 [Lentithecium fluviatile CBS 122367]